jgi:hypothetical protein
MIAIRRRIAQKRYQYGANCVECDRNFVRKALAWRYDNECACNLFVDINTVTIAYKGIAYKGKSLKWEDFRRLQDSHLTDSYCITYHPHISDDTVLYVDASAIYNAKRCRYR